MNQKPKVETEAYAIQVRESVNTFSGRVYETEGRRFVELNIVKPGWSKNGNYWTNEAVAQLKDRIMEADSKKLYVDHSAPSKFGRSVRDWVAQAIESKMDGDTPVVKVEVFTESDAAKDLWEKMVKYPEAIGTSVDAMCKLVTGEREGRTGRIVTEASKLNSLDFVTEASAGGGLVRVAASVQPEIRTAIRSSINETLMLLEAVITDYKMAGVLDEERKKFWEAFESLQSVIRNIFGGDNVDADGNPIEDTVRKEQLQKALDDFGTEIKSIDLKALSESVQKREESKMVTNLAEFAKEQPELYAAFVNQVKESLTSTETIQKQEAEAKSAKELLDSKVKELATLTENLKVAEAKVADYTAKEAIAKLLAERDAMIAEAKIPVELISEEFTFAVREAKDEAMAKALIVDRQKIAEQMKTNPSQWNRRVTEPVKESVVKDNKAVTDMGEKFGLTPVAKE